MEKIKYESKEEQFYSHMGEITRNYSTDYSTPHKWPFAIHS